MRYNRKSIRVVTGPASLAVSLADMKLYLAVESTADDALITDFIEVATESVKQYIRQSVMQETLELTMDGFAPYQDDALLALGPGVHTAHYGSLVSLGNEFDLPFSPIQSVTSITTYNRANTSAVFDASNYNADLQSGRVYLNEGVTWPDNLRDREAVKVEFVAGWTAIPKPVLQAIKQMVSIMYECRELCELPAGCRAILDPYRRMDNLAWS
jgi:hypothetical protein